MNLDPGALFASFLIGTIGFVLLAYGKKQSRVPQMVVGLVLMVFPYFVANVFIMLGIAAGILTALWLAVRSGM